MPIIRFLCRNKNKPKSKHKTFSLLPCFLIPYHRFGINEVMIIIGDKLVYAKSDKKIADKIYNSFDINDFNFEERYVNYWFRFFRQTVLKLISILKSNNQDTDFLYGKEGLKKGWEYLNGFSNEVGKYRNAIGFSRYFYEMQGGYRKNSVFLFGTASQFL